MKAKTKTKKNGRKFGRLKFDTKDPPAVEIPNCDLSNLRKPIDTSLSTLRQVVKLFETGTKEVQDILAYECHVIYECRICRSLFRSLINFISHKRIYCPDKYNVMCDNDTIPPPLTTENPVDSNSNENVKKNYCKNEKPLKNQSNTKGFGKKDLTSVVAMLQKKQSNTDYDDTKENSSRMRIIADTEQVLLEVIESNRAAFQTILEPKLSNIDSEDLMKAQVTELDNIQSCDTAILGPDGHILELSSDEKCDNPLQFSEKCLDITSDDCNPDSSLICSICDTKFATKKTLTFHMKSLHTPNRMVYPCPCCDNYFPSTWGVYRHLVKVHRKSNAQVRKLRADIQRKAYRKESTRAQDIEKDIAVKKLVNNKDNLSPTNENQEWMAHLESDGELQRCGGCGKRFDRKAALMAHFQICQRRQAACNDLIVKSKRVKSTVDIATESSVSISTTASSSSSLSSTNDTPSTKEKLPNVTLTKSTSLLTKAPTATASDDEPLEISIRVEDVASLSKDAWDKIGTETSVAVRNGEAQLSTSKHENSAMNDETQDVSDDPEIIFTKIEKTKSIPVCNGIRKKRIGKRDASIVLNKSSNFSLIQQTLERTKSPNATPRQVSELEKRIANITNLRKLQCVPCKRKFPSLSYLRRHMAGHINWYRFRCKVCDFKCFDKIDCIAHCNKIHNAKNDRVTIANMMVETPLEEHSTTIQSRSILKRKIPTNNPVDLEVIDVTKPATEVGTINNANEEIACIENGVIKREKNVIKHDGDDGSQHSDSDDGSPDTSEIAKKARLDEDPELRRMVMEVIFGSSETINHEKPGTSSDVKRSRDRPDVNEDLSNSSSTESETNHVSSSVKTKDSSKSDKRFIRATRNRTKVADKDFIYDLDAVLLKEPIEKNCPIEIKNTNEKKVNDIGKSKLDANDVTVLDVVETAIGSV